MAIQQMKKQSGFTLLELIVVVGVLGLITSLATDFVVNETNQKRYELTKSKLSAIRQGIIGTPGSRINGEVYISGFVADTGLVPEHLIAMIQDGYCLDPKFLHKSVDCEANNIGDWKSYSGWNGPYLNGLEKVQGKFEDGTDISYLSYKDGWGNNAQQWLNLSVDDEELTEDILNFGWWVRVSGTDLAIRSVGLNGKMDPGFDDSVLPLVDSLEADSDDKTNFDGLMQFEGDYPVTIFDPVSIGPPDFTLGLQNLVNNSEVSTVVDVKDKIAGESSVLLQVVNMSTSAISNDYCLVIESGSEVYISVGKEINLVQSQAEILNFSDFSDNSSAPVDTIPNGNYEYKLENPCPIPSSATALGSTLNLYIKNNGDFASLYEFL